MVDSHGPLSGVEESGAVAGGWWVALADAAGYALAQVAGAGRPRWRHLSRIHSREYYTPMAGG